jgi:hypothetical protein
MLAPNNPGHIQQMHEQAVLAITHWYQNRPVREGLVCDDRLTVAYKREPPADAPSQMVFQFYSSGECKPLLGPYPVPQGQPSGGPDKAAAEATAADQAAAAKEATDRAAAEQAAAAKEAADRVTAEQAAAAKEAADKATAEKAAAEWAAADRAAAEGAAAAASTDKGGKPRIERRWGKSEDPNPFAEEGTPTPDAARGSGEGPGGGRPIDWKTTPFKNLDSVPEEVFSGLRDQHRDPGMRLTDNEWPKIKYEKDHVVGASRPYDINW